MIPHLDYLVEMHNVGDLPAWEIVCHIVRYLSHSGSQSDYDQLPNWIKDTTRERIDGYQTDRAWLIYSNNGVEDFGKYADAFIARVRY